MPPTPTSQFLKSGGKFLGGGISSAAGFAAGLAIAPVLRPEVEVLAQDAWNLAPTRLADPGTLAGGVAQGQVNPATAAGWAKRQGYSQPVFDALVNIANTGPGVAEAFRLWRRDLIKDDGFDRALKRQAIEDEWRVQMLKTKMEPLAPADLARGIHKGLIPDPGLLVGVAHPGTGQVAPYPQYQIDAIKEASWFGIDHDHLGVLVGLQGNPMSVEQAAHAEFRKIVDYNDVLRAGAESNTRNEWVEKIYELARQIPTARDFLENALRGHNSLDWAYSQVARHGMASDDALVLWQNQGRALNPHQISQAVAWGASYNPAPTDIKDPYVAAIKLGPLRPEWEEMGESLKYIVPSAFALRTLQQTGALTPDEAFTWYKRLGWEPGLSRQVADAFGKTGPAELSPAVKSAQTRFITAIHKAYVKGGIDEQEMRHQLTLSGLSTADQGGVAAYFVKEHDLEQLPPPVPPTPPSSLIAEVETQGYIVTPPPPPPSPQVLELERDGYTVQRRPGA